MEPKNKKTEKQEKAVKVATPETTAEQKLESPSLIKLSDKDNPNAKWYVVHTNAGHEHKVAITLKQRVEASKLSDMIQAIMVPVQDKIVVTEGKKKTVSERLFPGYVLVKMELKNETWYIVRNTTGVTGFVGVGNKPTSLPPEEVKSIMKFTEMEAPKFEAMFQIGDGVRITDGPFLDFVGKVDSIDQEKGKVKVLVSVFGRETPVELDFVQVTRL